MKPEQALTLLNKLKKNREDVDKAYGVLLDMVGVGSAQAPLSEIITVIRHEMPDLHARLKRRVSGHQRLKLLFDLSMDYEHAKQRLGI